MKLTDKINEKLEKATIAVNALNIQITAKAMHMQLEEKKPLWKRVKGWFKKKDE